MFKYAAKFGSIKEAGGSDFSYAKFIICIVNRVCLYVSGIDDCKKKNNNNKNIKKIVNHKYQSTLLY